MSYAILKPKRGTAQQWLAVDPILKLGEMGIQVCDEGVGKGVCRVKFGDGVSKWSELPFGICPDAYASGLNIDVNNLVTKDVMSYTDVQLNQMNADVATNKARSTTNATAITQLQSDRDTATGRINKNASDIASLQLTADAATATASAANTNASNASNVANEALSKANNALTADSASSFIRVVSFNASTGVLTTVTGVG